MAEAYWTVESYVALTAEMRATLTARFGWTNVAGHTHAAIVAIRARSALKGNEHIETFVHSFVEASWTGNASGLENAINAACNSRLASAHDAQGPTAITGRIHRL